MHNTFVTYAPSSAEFIAGAAYATYMHAELAWRKPRGFKVSVAAQAIKKAVKKGAGRTPVIGLGAEHHVLRCDVNGRLQLHHSITFNPITPVQIENFRILRTIFRVSIRGYGMYAWKPRSTFHRPEKHCSTALHTTQGCRHESTAALLGCRTVLLLYARYPCIELFEICYYYFLDIRYKDPARL